MIRKVKVRNPWMPALYAMAGLGTLYIAVPRLPAFSEQAGGLFSAAWLGFSLLVVGSNLWGAVGADEEQTRGRQPVRARRLAVPPTADRVDSVAFRRTVGGP